MTVINFNNLSRGTVVDNEYTSQGVTISAIGGSNKAMIFDTANPTGGDWDLQTSNLGKALIISEDGDSNDPDDEADGGILRFAFSSATKVEALTFLDIEEGAVVRFYNQQGQLIKTQNISPTSNNGQRVVNFDTTGVYRMDVQLCGSGAVDNLTFNSGPVRDGYVDGTSGNDVIDINYVDTDGDRIDANDQILPGEGINDDIVRAGAGNDLVLAGNGNDEVYGGDGNDTLCGQDGDDTLFGENGNDILEGMNGNDLMFGGAGNDTIYGDAGNDTGFGGEGNDKIYGGTGNDTLHGDAGNDLINGGSGNDVAFGGEGNDEIWMGAGNDIASGGEGNDWMHGEDGNDLLNGGAGNDMLFGEGGDDTLNGDAGNDLINGGTGNDVIHGGAGDDSILGGDGNDVIYGDDGGASAPGRESFNWQGLTDNQIDNGYTVNTGTVTVVYGRTQDTGSHESSLSDVLLNTNGINSGGETVDNNSSLQSITNGQGNEGTFQWQFSAPVNNVSFNVNDIDGDGLVRITAYDADGNQIPVTLTGGGNLVLLDTDTVAGVDTADSQGGYDDPNTSGYNLNVTIVGPVSRIVLEHDQNGPNNSGINVTDIYYDGVVPAEVGGNDVIDGGAGDDLIYGNAGNDTISGGAGNDDIYGGDDRDVIMGAGGDTVDGGAGGDDYDILDITGQGPYILTGPDGTGTPIPDSNGNGIDGRVVFVDADGNPTGQIIDFTEIEEVRGDAFNSGPDATDDEFVADEDGANEIYGNVITGDTGNGADSDPDGDTLTVSEVNGVPANVGQPVAGSAGGVVTINADGTVSFNPNGEFEALGEGDTTTTTVTYTVSDPDGAESTATVTFTVTGTNDAPTAVADFNTVDEDTVTDLGNVVTANDTDPEGDTLTVAQVNGSDANVGQPVAGSNGGLITINADGTASFDPNGEFNGLADGETDTTEVTYTITDPDGATSTTTVTITVTGANDGPTATDNTYTVSLTEAAGDVDGNVITDNTGNGVDSDPENDTLTVVAVGGLAAGVGTAVAGDNGGMFTINPDGTVDFNANGDFDGLGLNATEQTSVTYTIRDENGAEDTATVTFTVTGTNDGTIQGTSGDDVINPDIPYVDADGDIVDGDDAILPGDSENDDLIYGYGGNDSIDAGDGDDEVYGGTGNDTIRGGAGNDTLNGNEGNDIVYGDDGDDTLNGNQGNDTLFGGAGNDVVNGGLGNDSINGGAGNDTLNGEDGNDTIEGGDGDDMINGGAGNDALSGGTGNDKIEGSEGEDTIYGGAGDDDIWGGLDDDALFGGSGDDTLGGGAGNDSIIGGSGSDYVEGGDGDDYIDTRNGSGAAFDYDYPSLPFGDDDAFPNNDLDTVFGGAGNDIIYTGDDADSIDGGDGDDFIDAGIDNDSVTGGAGNDTIIGGQGEDIIEGNDGDDLIYGGLDVDTFDEPDATDEAPDDNRDTIYGGNGNDTIYGRDDNDTLYGDAGNDLIFGGVDNDEIYGGEGNDVLHGDQGDDSINGGDGDDLIYGGDGNDTIDGGKGHDTIYGGAGNDVIQGNQDDDAIYGDEGDDTITGSLDDDLVFGGADNDEIRGGTGDDTLHGDAGDDYIQGGYGDDSLYGGDGNDSLNGGFGDDIVEGGAGDDTIAGFDGDDVLDGGDGDDIVYGGAGSDIITGGAGVDNLYGGLNSDTFYGGNGGDNVVGGEDPDDSDVDVLDLTGSNVDFITYTTRPDGTTDPESGVVTFLDGSTMTFSEIENVIPCFTPGTTIATAKGERLVEELTVGDRIITRDNGIQEIAWVGHKEMSGKQLVQNPHLKPILIKAGALGNGLPERDMMVSPNHRVLVASELTQLYFEENEVLAAAKHMVGSKGIHAVDVMSTTYVHFMFERHEVVLSNGAWTESFQPGDYSLKGIGNSQRNEIMEIFPELATKVGLEGYQSARKALKKHEAKLLIK